MTKILIFEGLNLVGQYDTNDNSMKTINMIYDDYAKKLKQMQEVIEEGETDEDIIVDEVEKELKKELDDRLKKVLKSIETSSRKTESFVSDKVMGKIGDIFTGFNTRINSLIGKAMSKFKINIINDNTITPQSKKKLETKYDLLAKNLKMQVKDTKDNVLQGIKRSVSNGIASGKSVSQIKSEIEKDFNYKDGIGWKVRRTINTSLRQASGILKLKKMLDQGFDEYEWISRNDSKVRPEHVKKNHKIFSIEKALKSDSMDAYPGKNFGCRCSIGYY